MFPKIQSPCPYRNQLAAVMDGDFCRHCQRTVFDLTAMDGAERKAFLSACETEVCVSYRIPVKPMLAAAALAAAAYAPAAAAQDVPAVQPAEVAAANTIPVDEGDIDYIVVGGIKDPKQVTFVENAEDAKLPELPVVYETAAKPVSRPAGS
ncbi:hypothetical protein [Sphingomonas sp. KR3-1]|uniref:hypothetical protein n=1 Tax=Sphingomonas sp. KR3-1 TaxID=3156611 RepID=UPI0032B5F337